MGRRITQRKLVNLNDEKLETEKNICVHPYFT